MADVEETSEGSKTKGSDGGAWFRDALHLENSESKCAGIVQVQRVKAKQLQKGMAAYVLCAGDVPPVHLLQIWCTHLCRSVQVHTTAPM